MMTHRGRVGVRVPGLTAATVQVEGERLDAGLFPPPGLSKTEFDKGF